MASDGLAAERTGSELPHHAVATLETQAAVTAEQSGAGRLLHAGYTVHLLRVCQKATTQQSQSTGVRQDALKPKICVWDVINVLLPLCPPFFLR